MKKKITLLLMLCMGVSQLSALTTPAWVQSARNKIQNTFGKMSQKVRSYVNEKGGCFFSGTCSPEVMKELKSIALKVGLSVGAVVTALVVTGGTAWYLQKEKGSGIGEYRLTPGASIEDIARGYGEVIPTDNSPEALVVRGAFGGAVVMVKDMVDIVSKTILQIAYDAAEAAKKSIPDPTKHPAFEQIKNTLKGAIRNFNEERLDRNLQFLNSAETGLLEEVKKVVCKIQMAPAVIREAITRLKRAQPEPHTGQAQTLEFLQKPVCE